MRTSIAVVLDEDTIWDRSFYDSVGIPCVNDTIEVVNDVDDKVTSFLIHCRKYVYSEDEHGAYVHVDLFVTLEGQ